MSPMRTTGLVLTLLLVAAAGRADDSLAEQTAALAPASAPAPAASSTTAAEDEADEGATDEPASFDLESNLRAVIERVFKEALPVVYRFSSGSGASGQCTAALLKWVLAVRRLDPWALRMVDAMGRPPAGIFEGTITDFGSFDQCLEVRAQDAWGDESFRGQYCSLFLKPNIDTSKPVAFLRSSRRNLTRIMKSIWFPGFRLGICIPSACSKEDIDALIKSALSRYGVNASVPLCDVQRDVLLDRIQKAAVAFLCIVLVMMLLGTVVDVFLRSRHGMAKKINAVLDALTSWSAYGNTLRLFDVSDDGGRLRPLHGIRFLTTLWIILAYSHALTPIPNRRRIFNMFDFVKETPFMFIANAYPAADTFFCLSGFLFGYSIFKQRHNIGKWLPVLLVRRYIRVIVPSMCLLLVFSLVELLSSGPIWRDGYAILRGNCMARWWKIPALINNWEHSLDSCLPHLWFFAADLQLLVAFSPAVVLLVRSPRLGLILTISMVLGSTLYVALQTYYKDLYPVTIFFADNVMYGVNASVPLCDVQRDVLLDRIQKAAVAFLCIVLVMMLLGTVVDVFLRSRHGMAKKINAVLDALTSWSAYGNTLRLFDVSDDGGRLRPLHGIRFLTTLWIILAYSHALTPIPNRRRIFNMFDFVKETPFMFIANAYPAADTFFCLSGFLFGYSIFKQRHNIGKWLPVLLVRRYIRVIVPSMCLLLVFSLVELLSSGPIWRDGYAILRGNCMARWWKIPALINNWEHSLDSCLPHLWFFAADLQLLVAFSPAVVLLVRSPRLGLILTISMVLGSTLYVALQTYYKDLYPVTIFFADNVMKSRRTNTEVFKRPFAHAGAFALGLLLALVLRSRTQWAERGATTAVRLAGWVVSAGCALAVILGVEQWHKGVMPSQAMAALYACLHKTTWGAFICWVAFVVCTDRKGILSRFLSWGPFVALSRLSYGAYLLHILVLYIRFGSIRERLYSSHFVQVSSPDVSSETSTESAT
ncbi:nose resistant to fluoxetine protein 6 [Ixodes scapularis]